MNRLALGVAADLYVRALCAVLAEEPGPDDWDQHPLDPKEVEKLAWREMRAIRDTILAHYDYQNREQRILNDRLTRRFDLGQALNEAAQRAIKEKQAAVPLGYPTEKQRMALAVQAESLTKTVRFSPLTDPETQP